MYCIKDYHYIDMQLYIFVTAALPAFYKDTFWKRNNCGDRTKLIAKAQVTLGLMRCAMLGLPDMPASNKTIFLMNEQSNHKHVLTRVATQPEMFLWTAYKNVGWLKL